MQEGMRCFSRIQGMVFFLRCGTVVLLAIICFTGNALGKIYIDINAPSIRKFNIAIPDFINLGKRSELSEMATKLPTVLSNDLDLSGYFSPMDKGAFLEEEGDSQTLETIRFKNWSVIGAELLVKGSYARVRGRMEVEVRVFDPFWGRQILGKRVMGKIEDYRYMMHRLGDEIIKVLTGQAGIFSTKLAFVGNQSGHKEIYRCDFDGHDVTQLTTHQSISLLPRWSPDGTQLLYTSYKDGGPMLYRKDIASGMTKRISSREGLNIGAAWAPDGGKVALTLSRKGNPDIYTIDLDGHIKRQLTNHWGIDVSPTFSPDGKKVAFVSNRSGSPHIYVRHLVKGTEERLTFFEGRYNTSPVWSIMNRLAFVSMIDGLFDIFTINPDGSQLRKLTENQGNNEDPCWSPDGRYIVFSSNRTGRYRLYIMNANGQNQRRITSMGGDHTAPSWSR